MSSVKWRLFRHGLNVLRMQWKSSGQTDCVREEKYSWFFASLLESQL